jgi:ribulose 1,5-bisphosphate synthetase/thiazole synthase
MGLGDSRLLFQPLVTVHPRESGYLSDLTSPGIAIVGAGIVGLSVAHHLIERGEKSLVLYERAGIGAGASGIQPGGVRLQCGTEVN